jgi:predicted nucleic acid-binding protein
VILVDSSTWIDHLRSGNLGLDAVLEDGLVLTHPFVIGELACGNITNRDEVLSLLHKLPVIPMATHSETLAFIERRSLMGRGVGYIDVHLLASTVLSHDTTLWTRDRRLIALARELQVAHPE